MRILLVEDEPEMSRMLAERVAHGGFTVDQVSCLAEARAALAQVDYALILLDRRLPDGEGLSLLPEVRRERPGASVLLISALDTVPEKVRGLDAGADDYLTKPFSSDELMARIRLALRRPALREVPPIRCGSLIFEPDTRGLRVNGQNLILKRRPLAILESLLRRVGRVVQRETLLEEVYGFDDEVGSNTLDSHISRLRAKLQACQAQVQIHSVRGVGYFLEASG